MLSWILALIIAGALQVDPAPAGVDVHFSLSWQAPQTCTLGFGQYREIVAEITGTTRLNVRHLPSTSSAIVGAIATGDIIRQMPAVPGDPVGSLGNDWYPVILESGAEGYAHAGYLDAGDFTWSCG